MHEDENPTEQLDLYRARRGDWRHDTAEFPAVTQTLPVEELRSPRGPHRRPGGLLLAGLGLLACALIIGGLAALGVGPVRHWFGSDGGTGSSPAPTTSTSVPATAGSSATTAISPSATPTVATTQPAGPPPPGGDQGGAPGDQGGPGGGPGKDKGPKGKDRKGPPKP